MAKLSTAQHQKLINLAILQFKLAIAVSASVDGKENQFKYLGQFTWGHHAAGSRELTLSRDDEQLAAAIFEHSATYLLALQIDKAFQDTIPDRFTHEVA